MNVLLPIGISLLFVFAPTFPLLGQLIPDTAHEPEIPFHTLAFQEGKTLPVHITTPITLTANDGVVIVHTQTTVDPGVTLFIQPGTILAFNEYAGITVHGALEAKGTTNQPIQFISNELNESNKNWNGVLYAPGSTGTIEHAIFHHASPAVSCSSSAKVTTQNNSYAFGNLEVYGPC